MNFISLLDMIKDPLKNFNHGMPESLQISEFQGHLVNSIQLLLWVLRIIIPNIGSSIRYFTRIDNDFTLELNKNIRP